MQQLYERKVTSLVKVVVRESVSVRMQGQVAWAWSALHAKP